MRFRVTAFGKGKESEDDDSTAGVGVSSGSDVELEHDLEEIIDEGRSVEFRHGDGNGSNVVRGNAGRRTLPASRLPIELVLPIESCLCDMMLAFAFVADVTVLVPINWDALDILTIVVSLPTVELRRLRLVPDRSIPHDFVFLKPNLGSRAERSPSSRSSSSSLARSSSSATASSMPLPTDTTRGTMSVMSSTAGDSVPTSRAFFFLMTPIRPMEPGMGRFMDSVQSSVPPPPTAEVLDVLPPTPREAVRNADSDLVRILSESILPFTFIFGTPPTLLAHLFTPPTLSFSFSSPTPNKSVQSPPVRSPRRTICLPTPI